MATIIPKRILILGNGFDLAHGLPTKYSDFLAFSIRAMRIYTYPSDMKEEQYYNNNIANWNNGDNANEGIVFLKTKLVELYRMRVAQNIPSQNKPRTFTTVVSVNDRLDLFYKYLVKNVWFRYIVDLGNNIKGENWIDFESEISLIIEVLDNAHDSLLQSFYDLKLQIEHTSMPAITAKKVALFIKTSLACYEGKPYDIVREVNIHLLRTKLYNDLEDLILAFEIYLTDFVEEIPISKTLDMIEDIKPSHVISFNYTRTYEKVYIKAGQDTQICYIHGSCKKDRLPENNNMVLGIGEYLPVNLRSECTDFCIFKKFVQRIRKHNDVSYAAWSEGIEKRGAGAPLFFEKNENGKMSTEVWGPITDIYVYGHSLDVTDKDILQKFLDSPYTRIRIYARDKASEGNLIANFIRITSEDTVINKSTTNPPLIEFYQ